MKEERVMKSHGRAALLLGRSRDMRIRRDAKCTQSIHDAVKMRKELESFDLLLVRYGDLRAALRLRV